MPLPNPQGLSGAFIFKIDKFEGKIWDVSSVTKAIAIQSTMERKINSRWIKGSSIKFLYQLLP